MRRLDGTEEIKAWPLMHRPFTSQQPDANPLQVNAAISPSNEPRDAHTVDTHHQMMSGWQSRQENPDETATGTKEAEPSGCVRERESVMWDGRGVLHIKASSLVWKISWALWSTGAFYLLM